MTILSSLFETVSEQLDGIVNVLRRTKPVPPQPSVRNHPSGSFELDINIDENQYTFKMGENGNIEYVNEEIYEEGRYFKRIDSSISEKIYEIAPEDIANEVLRMFNQYDNVGVFSNYPIDDPEAYEEAVFFSTLVVLIAYNNDRGMVEEISVFYEGENISFAYGDNTTIFDEETGILNFEDDNGYISFGQDSDELVGYNP